MVNLTKTATAWPTPALRQSRRDQRAYMALFRAEYANLANDQFDVDECVTHAHDIMRLLGKNDRDMLKFYFKVVTR